MVNRGLVTPAGAWAYFDAIEPRLYRYPATFRTAIREAFGAPTG